jgi:hypothetical protein
MSKFFISIFMLSDFLFSRALIDILNQISNAQDACASERSDSEKCHTSLCITLIVTFGGSCIKFTACLSASIEEDQSDFSINLSSASLSDLSHDINCCIADSGVCFFACSAISHIFVCASFSFLTISMIRPGSGNSVIHNICTGSHHVAFWMFCHFRFCILLTLP